MHQLPVKSDSVVSHDSNYRKCRLAPRETLTALALDDLDASTFRPSNCTGRLSLALTLDERLEGFGERHDECDP